MPLYEYECDQCGHRFEVIQKFSDAPVEKCPVCGGAVHKLQSAPAFQFKGSGWYVTDYAKKDSVPAGKTAEKSEKSEKTDKSDDKPKTETKSSTESSSSPTTPKE